MKNFGEKGSWAYPGTAQIFRVHPIISGTGKATNFKFCTHILSIDWNKSPLQISRKVAVCVVRTLKNFQGTHISGASRGLLCDSSAVLLSKLTWTCIEEVRNHIEAKLRWYCSSTVLSCVCSAVLLFLVLFISSLGLTESSETELKTTCRKWYILCGIRPRSAKSRSESGRPSLLCLNMDADVILLWPQWSSCLQYSQQAVLLPGLSFPVHQVSTWWAVI